ncbi:MAG: UDP-N-acetylmuramoyl-tripeptide--D-alanyl-D-alanine ligase [Actinomycetes bacterium]
MIALTLGEIADVVGGRVGTADDAGVTVSGPAVIDSRRAAPGSLFVALQGERVDGHDFVATALAAGSTASLVTRPVVGPHVVVADVQTALGRLSRAVIDRLVLTGNLTVVGLTGSSGKTSTKDLVAQVLATFAATVATEENLNNELGVPVTALRADESTRHLVLEMGARGTGHVGYLAEVAPPRIGLVLNIGSAHAGEFGGVEATARAKSELVQALPDAAHGGVALLNADDARVAAMSAVTRARVVTFGTSTGADVRAVDVRLDTLGRPGFLLAAGGATTPVSLQVHGEHQVSNALASAAVALEVGMPLADVAAALSEAGARSRWRMEVTERSDGVTVVNDAYNANPESMRAGLEALAAMARPDGGRRRRTWAVLGEMLELGAASDAAHADIGRLTRSLGVDRVVVVGEGARAIHAGAVSGGAREGEESVVVPDREAAHALLRDQLRPGDLVLFKSSRDAGLRWLGDDVAGADAASGVAP